MLLLSKPNISCLSLCLQIIHSYVMECLQYFFHPRYVFHRSQTEKNVTLLCCQNLNSDMRQKGIYVESTKTFLALSKLTTKNLRTQMYFSLGKVVFLYRPNVQKISHFIQEISCYESILNFRQSMAVICIRWMYTYPLITTLILIFKNQICLKTSTATIQIMEKSTCNDTIGTNERKSQILLSVCFQT